MGSGFTIKMQGGVVFNLCTLYTATKEERSKQHGQERLQKSRMLAQQAQDGEDEQQEPVYQLNPQVKEFCKTVDALIFVNDASQDLETSKINLLVSN